MWASSIGRPHAIIAWLHACPVCAMWEQFPSRLQSSPWRTGQSWDRDRTIVPFSGWFDQVDGAVAQSMTAVGLPLSTVLQFPGDSPSALALVSMGTVRGCPLFPIFSMSFSLFLSLAFLPLLLLLPTSLLHSSSCLLCLPPSFLSLGFPSLVHP